METLKLPKYELITKISIYIFIGSVILLLLNCGNNVRENNDNTNVNFQEFLSLFKKIEWSELNSKELVGKGLFDSIENENMLREFICDYSNTCLFSKTHMENNYVATYTLSLGEINLVIYLLNEGKDTGGDKVVVGTYNKIGEKIDKLIIHGSELKHYWRFSSFSIKDRILKIDIETKYYALNNSFCNLESTELEGGVQCFILNNQSYEVGKDGVFMQNDDSGMIPTKMKRDSLNRFYIKVE